MTRKVIRKIREEITILVSLEEKALPYTDVELAKIISAKHRMKISSAVIFRHRRRLGIPASFQRKEVV